MSRVIPSRRSVSTLRLAIAVFTARLRSDARGVAAVEFGLLAPILLLMLLGTIELSRAISMDRKFGLVTATIADLVAREKALTAADVNAMYDIVQHMMKPWNSSTLKIAITPVKSSPTNANDVRVYAGVTNRPTLNGMTQRAKCSTYALPSNFLPTSSSVIIVEASYQFTPLFAGSIIGSSTWTEKSILSPRNSCVDFDTPSNCVSGCWSGG